MSLIRLFSNLILLWAYLILVSCGGSPKSGNHNGEVKILQDIPYRSAGLGANPRRQSLDLFLPPPGTADPPLLVFIHGGFWILSDDEYKIGPSLADELASRGVAVALVRYRLGPKHRHPAQAQDVAAAVSHLIDNAARYGFDPRQIYLAGHSAGAHLAALIALDESYLNAYRKSSKNLAGVVGISGIYNLSDRSEFSVDQRRAIRDVFGDDPRVLREASPVTHVKPGAPPFLLLSASGDLFGFNVDTRRFSDALNHRGGQKTAPMVISERDHLSAVQLAGPKNITRDLVMDFLKLKPLSGFLSDLAEAKRLWLQAAPSTELFWKHKDLVRSYPIDQGFMYNIIGHYGRQKDQLVHWSFDKFHAIDLFEYLKSLPEEKLGKGDYLVLTNLRNEKMVWHKDEIRPYDPVIVIGIDDERNLFKMGGFYRMRKAYSWKEGVQPPTMARPVGAFIYFLKPTPPNLKTQSWHFAMTEESFQLVAKDPLAPIKESLPRKVYEVMTFKNGCLYCHKFRGIGSRSHHILAATGATHEGFAMRLEDYPAEVWKRFVFEQEAVAHKIGATPNLVGKSMREPLYDLVVQGRERKGSVIFRQ